MADTHEAANAAKEREKTSAAAAYAANEKAASETRAAAVGAQAVAEAVKKVAEAAVAEISKAKSGPAGLDFDAFGTPGGLFTIDGAPGSFGASGTVLMGKTQLHTREWSSSRIVGDLPAGTKSGEVVVHLDSETSKKGYLVVS